MNGLLEYGKCSSKPVDDRLMVHTLYSATVAVAELMTWTHKVGCPSAVEAKKPEFTGEGGAGAEQPPRRPTAKRLGLFKG